MTSGYETKKDNRNHADTAHGKTFNVILLLIDKTNVNHASILEHTKHRTTQRVSLKSGQGFGYVRLKRVYLPIEVLARSSRIMIHMHNMYIYRWPFGTCLTEKRRSCIVVATDLCIQGPPKKCIHTLTKENSTLYNRLL